MERRRGRDRGRVQMPEPTPFAPMRGRKRGAAIDGKALAKRIRTGSEAQSRDLGALASSERDFKTRVARLCLRTSGGKHGQTYIPHHRHCARNRQHQFAPSTSPSLVWHACSSRNSLSAVTTQQLTERATAVGASGVEGLARVGTSGKWVRNSSRGLIRYLVQEALMPPLYWAAVPMREPRLGANNVLTWMPFCWSTKRWQLCGPNSVQLCVNRPRR